MASIGENENDSQDKKYYRSFDATYSTNPTQHTQSQEDPKDILPWVVPDAKVEYRDGRWKWFTTTCLERNGKKVILGTDSKPLELELDVLAADGAIAPGGTKLDPDRKAKFKLNDDVMVRHSPYDEWMAGVIVKRVGCQYKIKCMGEDTEDTRYWHDDDVDLLRHADEEKEEDEEKERHRTPPPPQKSRGGFRKIDCTRIAMRVDDGLDHGPQPPSSSGLAENTSESIRQRLPQYLESIEDLLKRNCRDEADSQIRKLFEYRRLDKSCFDRIFNFLQKALTKNLLSHSDICHVTSKYRLKFSEGQQNWLNEIDEYQTRPKNKRPMREPVIDPSTLRSPDVPSPLFDKPQRSFDEYSDERRKRRSESDAGSLASSKRSSNDSPRKKSRPSSVNGNSPSRQRSPLPKISPLNNRDDAKDDHDSRQSIGDSSNSELKIVIYGFFPLIREGFKIFKRGDRRAFEDTSIEDLLGGQTRIDELEDHFRKLSRNFDLFVASEGADLAKEALEKAGLSKYFVPGNFVLDAKPRERRFKEILIEDLRRDRNLSKSNILLVDDEPSVLDEIRKRDICDVFESSPFLQTRDIVDIEELVASRNKSRESAEVCNPPRHREGQISPRKRTHASYYAQTTHHDSDPHQAQRRRSPERDQNSYPPPGAPPYQSPFKPPPQAFAYGSPNKIPQQKLFEEEPSRPLAYKEENYGSRAGLGTPGNPSAAREMPRNSPPRGSPRPPIPQNSQSPIQSPAPQPPVAQSPPRKMNRDMDINPCAKCQRDDAVIVKIQTCQHELCMRCLVSVCWDAVDTNSVPRCPISECGVEMRLDHLEPLLLREDHDKLFGDVRKIFMSRVDDEKRREEVAVEPSPPPPQKELFRMEHLDEYQWKFPELIRMACELPLSGMRQLHEICEKNLRMEEQYYQKVLREYEEKKEELDRLSRDVDEKLEEFRELERRDEEERRMERERKQPERLSVEIRQALDRLTFDSDGLGSGNPENYMDIADECERITQMARTFEPQFFEDERLDTLDGILDLVNNIQDVIPPELWDKHKKRTDELNKKWSYSSGETVLGELRKDQARELEALRPKPKPQEKRNERRPEQPRRRSPSPPPRRRSPEQNGYGRRERTEMSHRNGGRRERPQWNENEERKRDPRYKSYNHKRESPPPKNDRFRNGGSRDGRRGSSPPRDRRRSRDNGYGRDDRNDRRGNGRDREVPRRRRFHEDSW